MGKENILIYSNLSSIDGKLNSQIKVNNPPQEKLA